MPSNQPFPTPTSNQGSVSEVSLEQIGGLMLGSIVSHTHMLHTNAACDSIATTQLTTSWLTKPQFFPDAA